MPEVAEAPVVESPAVEPAAGAPPVSEAPAASEAKTRLSDDPKLVDTVQSRLDAFAEENGIEVEEPAEKSAEKVEPEPAVKPTEMTDEPTEKPVEAAPATDTGPTLPAAYRRSALSREWTDEEIDKFYRADPELALRTFGKIHESRVNEIAQWAELGRRAKQNPPASSAAPVAAKTEATGEAPTLKPVDTKAMVEKYGNEELITEIVAPINAVIASLQPIVAQAQVEAKRTQESNRAVLAKAVQDFFASDELKPYAKVYGGLPATLTAGQVETRGKMLEEADALLAGAALQGRNLSLQDALTFAHDAVSGKFKDQVIRDQIRASTKAREKGLSIKPTHRGEGEGNGPPKDRSELESRTARRLASVFG